MSVDFKDNVPIYLQIMQDIKKQIAAGKLHEKDKVSSVRELALYYGVNPNTVQKALSELEREGLMKSERTLGRFISIDDEKIKDIKKHLALETTYEYLNNIKEIGYSKNEILELIKEVTKDEQ